MGKKITGTIKSQRSLKGLEMVNKEDLVKRVDPDTYSVNFQNGEGPYLVTRSGKKWGCECSDYKYGRTMCKHIYAVCFSLTMRLSVASQVQLEIETLTIEGCKKCGSLNIIKIGIRHNVNGNVQRFLCKECGCKFINNDGFEKFKATQKAITYVLDSYFKGMSQRKIVDFIKKVEGVKVTQPCVLKWIRKCTDLMDRYLEQFQLQVNEIGYNDRKTLNGRRTKPENKGNYAWLWSIMDQETRFLLASQVTKHREIEDARRVFKKVKHTTNKKLDLQVADKLQSYKDSFNKEFFIVKNPKAKQVLLHIKEKKNDYAI